MAVAVLHHERVAGAAPVAWLLFTHGIYGSGGNWRSIARKVVDRRPDWGAVLVDLRGHGRSPAGDPPHTVDACAADLAAAVDGLAAAGAPVRAACGHSFGGKCVLALRDRAATTPLAVPLAQTWVLDATPSARPATFDADDNTVRQVLEVMERLPPRFAHRDDFVAAIVAAGHPPTLGHWLAMNLVAAPAAEGGGLRLRLDLVQVRTLLGDYFRRDLWAAVEDPAMPGDLHVVLGGASRTVPDDDRARLTGAAAVAARTIVDVIPGAGHWLHIDAPAAVVDLIAGALPPAR
ncbi:MAG: alpha/beta hydrolase [Kofleriaceae bacterium]|nr:alpha/beta hydrolase [Kofleriaceae bacterium]MCB9573245.1 alpha/beta hydrolase [Kofleriaceae bacterium]